MVAFVKLKQEALQFEASLKYITTPPPVPPTHSL